MRFSVYFITLAILMLSISSVIGASGSCTPSSSEYKHCYYSSYTYGSATANAKVEVSDVIGGTYKGGYFVGTPQIKYKFTGDDYNVKTGSISSWSAISCSSSGCDGQSLESSGVYTIPLKTSSGFYGYTDNIAFYVQDYNKATDGAWAWSWAGYGWLGTNKLNLKVVKCYEESDCISGFFCDKTQTDWTKWNCKAKECETIGATKMVEASAFVCKDYLWKYMGDCINGEQKVNATGRYSCEVPEGTSILTKWILIEESSIDIINPDNNDGTILPGIAPKNDNNRIIIYIILGVVTILLITFIVIVFKVKKKKRR